MTAYRYSYCFLRIILMYFSHRIRISYPFLGVISNGNLFNLKVYSSLFNTEETKTFLFTRLPVTRWVKLSLNFELLEEDFLFYIYYQRIY